MITTTTLKRKIKTAFNLSINRPIGSIYMLHRVSPLESTKLHANENMKVSPEFLERFIVENQSRYTFVSMDQVAAITSKRGWRAKPFIAFTFDDGYLDNFGYAYPIFKKYNVPFTIYISTGLIDHSAILWWYYIEDIILSNDTIFLSNGLTFECKSKAEKESVFLQIRKIVLELPTADFGKQLSDLFSHYPTDFAVYTRNLMMSWENIKELSQSDLCTIASHAVSHRRLSELSDTELLYELTASKKIIQEKTGKSVDHFAYPFGTTFEVSDRVIKTMQQTDYKTALLSNGGCIRRFINNNYGLSRIMLTETI